MLLDKKVVPLAQREIYETLHLSKIKTNEIFVDLQNKGLIIKMFRGKYILSKKAEVIIKNISKIDSSV